MAYHPDQEKLQKLQELLQEKRQEVPISQSLYDFDPSNLWSFQYCTQLLEKFLNESQREEWLGDLEEAVYRMHDIKYPKWRLHFQTLRRTFIILVANRESLTIKRKLLFNNSLLKINKIVIISSSMMLLSIFKGGLSSSALEIIVQGDDGIEIKRKNFSNHSYPKWRFHIETLRRTFDLLKTVILVKANPLSYKRKSTNS